MRSLATFSISVVFPLFERPAKATDRGINSSFNWFVIIHQDLLKLC